MAIASITFKSLLEVDFPLLLKWLQTPHVKAWWDQEVHWTLELISEKYGSYVAGYKLENGESRKIRAYIILADQTPIGYIQIYNAYDFHFARARPLVDLPVSLAVIDFYIGEPSVLGQGMGAQVLNKFLDDPVYNHYAHTLVDPDVANVAAIRTYENAGFRQVKIYQDIGKSWMIRENFQRPKS